MVKTDIIAKNNLLTISIEDNGCGMDENMLKKVSDPFTTTRKTRKVGLGIPLFKQASEMANGKFEIKSQKNVGTTIIATFQQNHIDRAPLGDLAQTIITLFDEKNDIDFVYNIEIENNKYEFDTRILKRELNGISICEPNIIVFVRDMIKENLNQIGGENL